MANWYFYENGTKYGSITTEQLKILVSQGRITRETVVETEDGRTSEAGKIKGLEFPEAPAFPGIPAPPVPEPEQQVPDFGAMNFGQRNEESNPFTGASSNTGGITKTTAPHRRVQRPSSGFDLSSIFGGIGDIIDEHVLVNMGVILKIQYWLFIFFYFLGVIISCVGVLSSAVQFNLVWPYVYTVLMIPISIVVWYFLRVGFKFSIEVVKLLIKLNRYLDESNQQ